MRLFDTNEISKNWVYSPVMEEIEELYEKMGSPMPPSDGPTTGGALEDYYMEDYIGDFNGHEEDACGIANSHREFVLDSLNRGSYPYYYESDEWCEFADAAYELVLEYEANNEGYNRLCDLWEEKMGA